jgi:tRNA-splicing ligase RtcB
VSPHPEGPKLLVWGDIEPKTIEQAHRSSTLPFIDGHVALMPDAHYGYGATIGSVIPTRGAIIPSAIGVDIGCGMIACELPFTSDLLPDNLDQLHDWISKVVPAGVGQGHHTKQTTLPSGWSQLELTDKQTSTAIKQMGSLGGGNHFVEICLDERDRVWIVLHSGSRGIGNQLATRHIEKAKGLMKQYFIDLEDPDLAYLVEGTIEFRQYIAAMLWSQEWALKNRQAMMDAVVTQVRALVGCDFEPTRTINCHHNFTEHEHHHGKDVWLTRKGAIRARQGDWGVIPGSMGTRSYIVEGLGNPASYHSSSHGAGRTMSRSAARKTLDLEGFKQSMQGKAWNEAQAVQLLDEDPRSYKDIDQVMADQADLTEIRHTLHQVLNYKGVS